MKLGFDAKRAFFNRTGLGNYSRTLLSAIEKYHHDEELLLFTPKEGTAFLEKAKTVMSTRAFWRSYGMGWAVSEENPDVFVGLSNELPFDIEYYKGKKVVVIHDLIFMRYPKWYKLIDRRIYEKKTRFACAHADVVIATSEQTKKDIIDFYGVATDKIEVVYQSCSEIFKPTSLLEGRSSLQDKYGLPGDFVLYVGALAERKNVLNLIEAMSEIEAPLVLAGRGNSRYEKKLRRSIKKKAMQDRVLLLSNVPNEDLPAIYQLAKCFAYPSLFEGFGIPILEALWTNTPVVTSTGSCFSEVGGPDTLYADPNSVDAIRAKIRLALDDEDLAKQMSEKGYEHAQQFTPKAFADRFIEAIGL